ncbi:MAG: hypothetical protein HY698_16755 [Deltaproteobacteria bacterium]|nr:hypothetical protein [Deltaproteobacteria bacterium]
MRVRLGEILLQQGAITPEMLEAALRAQVVYGGRLGTNLVEMGYADLDTIARALSVQLGVPAALQKHFEQIDPSTVAMVPARVAERHQAIPIGVTSRGIKKLVVAFIDPLQFSSVDEVAFAAGCRLQPCVAPELRIVYYLEKLYRVARKNRYIRMDHAFDHAGGSSPALAGQARTGKPGGGRSTPPAVAVEVPPDDGVVIGIEIPDEFKQGHAFPDNGVPREAGTEPTSGKAEAATPRAQGTSVRSTLLPGAAVPPPSSPFLRTPAAAALAPARPDNEAHARPQAPTHALPSPTSSIVSTLRPGAPIPVPMVAPSPAPPPGPVAPPVADHEQAHVRPALSVSDAAAKIGAASGRDEIGDALTDYLRSGFGCGLVLIARDGMALGWKGFAPGLDPSIIESIAVPLTAPSMLRIAHEGRAPFRGAPPSDGAALQGRLWKLLKSAPPSEVAVVPIILKERVVNLVYVHAHGGGPLNDTLVSDLAMACASAATAFARLIQSGKARMSAALATPKLPDDGA